MNDEDKYIELFKRLFESQQKYTYFILFTAASAIAFSVQITQNLTASMQMIPLAIAVVSWLLSFICGCWYILNGLTITFANLHQLKNGAKSKRIESVLTSQQKKSISNFKWQFRFLILGVISFITWKVFVLCNYWG